MIRTIAAALLLLSSGCALIPMSAATRDARAKKALLQRTVGCYRLTIGAWNPPMQLEAPEMIRLRSELLDFSPYNRSGIAGMEIRAMDGSARPFMWSRPLPSNWRLVGSDEIELSYSAAYHGVGISLKRSDSILTGTARYWDDYIDGKPRPTAPATAVKIGCPPAKQ